VGGGVDGPANYLEIPLVCFLEKIGCDEVAAHGELPRTNFDGFFERVVEFSIMKKPGHQGRLDFAKIRENGRVEGNDDDPGNFAGIAQVAYQGMFAAPEAAGLEFEIEDHVVLAGEFEDFYEGRDAFADEFAGEPRTGVEAASLGEGHVMDVAFAAGGAIHGFVMDGNEMSIAGKVQIGFNEGDALGNRAAESGQRIFRGVTRGAAMGDG